MSIRGYIAGLLLVAGCGPQAQTPVPVTPEPIDAGARAPTAKQKQALANPLHRAHLDAEDPSACRDCHRIRGPKPVASVIKHRCLACHEDYRSALHANSANDLAKECLSCHEFLAAEVDPWSCGDCHRAASGQGPPSALNGHTRRATVEALVDTAPAVAVHEKDCDSCHAPHGDRPVAPKSCLSCHEKKSARHDSVGRSSGPSAAPNSRASLPEPQQCLECHGGHQPAATAGARCAKCHDQSGFNSALFKGHEACTECHQPHSTPTKKRCETCHNDQITVGARHYADHQTCLNCHRPHTVVSSARNRCGRCHEDVSKSALGSHPTDKSKGPCVGCHPQHPVEGVLTKATACSRCHDLATDDVQLHSGVACKSCHVPHDFDLKKAGSTLCGSCHVGSAPAHPRPGPAKTVKPVNGHDRCSDCHEQANHFPERVRKDCGRCHEDQRRWVSTSHVDCASCHAPHDGVLRKGCADCHQTQVTTGQHRLNAKDCATCHSIHAKSPRRPKACTSCHKPPLPLLHQSRGHGSCSSCHSFHGQAARSDRKSCLTSCHQNLVNHEPEAPQCIGCHPFQAAPKGVRR